MVVVFTSDVPVPVFLLSFSLPFSWASGPKPGRGGHWLWLGWGYLVACDSDHVSGELNLEAQTASMGCLPDATEIHAKRLTTGKRRQPSLLLDHLISSSPADRRHDTTTRLHSEEHPGHAGGIRMQAMARHLPYLAGHPSLSHPSDRPPPSISPPHRLFPYNSRRLFHPRSHPQDALSPPKSSFVPARWEGLVASRVRLSLFRADKKTVPCRLTPDRG